MTKLKELMAARLAVVDTAYAAARDEAVAAVDATYAAAHAAVKAAYEAELKKIREEKQNDLL